jgi:proteasome accessory factor C
MKQKGLGVLRKVLTILPLVQANQGIRVAELARLTGIPEQELAGDLPDLVNLCGVPPYSPVDLVDLEVEGDRVTIRFADQFRRPIRLTLREALALDMALAGFAKEDAGPFADAVRGLRAKVRAALSPEVARDVNQAGKRIGLVGSPGLAGKILSVLKDALLRQVEVRVEYFSRSSGKLSPRTLRTYGFYEQSGHWYVVAWSVERERLMTFRADRIRSVVPLKMEYVIPEEFEVATYRQSGPPDAEGKGVSVTIRFEPEVARFAREGFPAVEFRDEEDGGVVAHLTVTGHAWLVSELLRWGGGATVLSPPEIRRELRERVAEALAQYGRK